MLRDTMRVVLALVAGAVVCLAAPAAAVAHGHAHAELIEHALDDHGSGAHTDAPAVGQGGHHEGHGHPTVEKGVSSRGIQPLSALPPRPVQQEFAVYADGVAVPAPTPFEPPPDPHDRAPAQPRAPPVISAL